MPANILIVEDEPAIQELLTVNLTRNGYQVTCVELGQQAKAHISAVLPDLILLDWMLPDISGIKLAKQIRTDTRTQDIPLIMLTARSTEQDKIDGLDSGADDYITKPFSPRELVARIKSLLRRRAPQLANEIVTIGSIRLDPNQRQIISQDNTINIAPTEFRLLHFLATHANRVYTRSQLLDFVWGDHVFMAERTVDVHIRRLRKILAQIDGTQYIQTVHGSGYCFKHTDS